MTKARTGLAAVLGRLARPGERPDGPFPPDGQGGAETGDQTPTPAMPGCEMPGHRPPPGSAPDPQSGARAGNGPLYLLLLAGLLLAGFYAASLNSALQRLGDLRPGHQDGARGAAAGRPPLAFVPSPSAPFPAPPPAVATPSADRPPVAALPGAERWTPSVVCPRDKVAPRQYNRCLYDTVRTTEQALEAALSDALAAIDARADLLGVQRGRWKTLLDEAQSRFLLFRNFDCQSVAPFEGRRGIGNFEQRALCLIETNLDRAADLKARYVTPQTAAAGPSAGPGGQPAGPARRPGVWTFSSRPPVD